MCKKKRAHLDEMSVDATWVGPATGNGAFLAIVGHRLGTKMRPGGNWPEAYGGQFAGLSGLPRSVHSFGERDQTCLVFRAVKEFYEVNRKPVPAEIAGILPSRRR